MSKTANYFLPSLTLCSLVFAWWIGGYDWFLSTGWLNVSFCLGIVLVAIGHYIFSFRDPSLSWVGADNCISLGLLGTVVGLVMALPNINDIGMAALGIGMALITTGVGLVCNVILFNHGYYLSKDHEENLQ